MQKVVIDTNVLVSSLIQRSYPYLIVNRLVIEGRIQMCVSEQLMAEYYEVLARPKFATFHDFFERAEALLAYIGTKAVMYVPQISLHLIKDTDDNMILELADEAAADFIITGNTTDFTFPTYRQTRIVTPRTYWEEYSD
jgi:putative PIN family toxin of toxin-antitoxin system